MSENTAATLDRIMGIAYAAEVMGKKPKESADDLFTAAVADDPDFKSAAQAKMQELSAVPEQRCFVSKTNAAFLRRMLAS